MSDPSSLSLDDALTAYVSSEYFTGLAAITRRKRRGMLRNMRADVLDLLGLPVTPLPALALLTTRPLPPQFKPYSGAARKNALARPAPAPDGPAPLPDGSAPRPKPAPRRGSWTTA